MRDGRYALRLEELGERVLPRSPFEAPSLGPPPAPGADVVWVGTVGELQTAVRNLHSGQTIVVRPGTYDLTETLVVGKFAPVTNVTIRGATDDFNSVVIRGKGMENAAYGAVPHGISVYNAQDVTIADLSVGQVYFHPIDIQGVQGADRVHLYHIRAFDGGEQLVKSSAGGDGADDCTVEFSLFEYTAAPPTTDHGGGTGYTGGIHAHQADRWVIRDNLWRNFHTSDSAANRFGPVILMWNGSADTVVEGNTFIDCDRAIAFGLIDQPGFDDHHGGVIRDNFVYQTPGLFSAARRAESDAQIIVYDSPGSAVYHNTVLTNGNSRFSIEVRWATSGVTFTNNLADAPVRGRDGGLFTAAGNYLSATPAMFANPAGGDLHLLDTVATRAAVIDKAVTLAGADWDGDSRPAVGADVGADERRAAPSSPPAGPGAGTPSPGPSTPAAAPAPAPAAPAKPVLGGALGGPGGLVVGLNPDGSIRFVRQAAYPGYAGRLSVAVGDVNADGAPDVITGTADGVAILRVFSGADGAELMASLPFGGLPIGINVAAGDIDGDGRADVVVGTSSMVPLVAAYSGRDLSPLRMFLAFPGYGGGINVAAGDIDGDGRADIVAGSVSGVGIVGMFSGATGATLGLFLASGSAGVFVAAGDLDGDGRAEVVTGAAAGPAEVSVFSPASGGRRVADFFPLAGAGGVYVAVADRDGDGNAELVFGGGPGGLPVVAVYAFPELGPVALSLPFGAAFAGGIPVA